MQTIKIGSRGSDVVTAQKALGVTPDGIFGNITLEAVKKFQSEAKARGDYHGEVDGIVGPMTWAALIPASGDDNGNIKINYQPLPAKCSRKPGRSIKYLAIHYTAGASSKPGSALAVRKVFLSRQASADFAVDDSEIVQINPDPKNYYCWAVGDKRSTSAGGGSVTEGCNANTISIEVCCNLRKGALAAHGNHDGWTFTEATINNAVKLAKYLMKEYDIPLSRVVRHYDISGKLCPGIIGWNDGPLIDSAGKSLGKKNTSEKWLEFKKRLQ